MEINCSFAVYNWLKFGSIYTCVVESADISKRCEVKSIKGVHQTGKCNSDVGAIFFNCTNVQYLPLDLHKIFPNLKRFEVFNCGLKEISSRDLRGFENLEVISLRDNPLESLPDNLFEKLTNLSIINLSGNQLKFVSSRLLNPIPEDQLLVVNFQNNLKIDSFYDPLWTTGAESIAELKKIIDSSCSPPQPVGFNERVKRNFKDLWDQFPDFTVIAGGREIRVHKCVLAVQSSVIATMLQTDVKVKESNKLVITDYGSEIVEQFLRLMYYGEFEDDQNALEMFNLSAEYKFDELEDLCEKMVIKTLNHTNALRAFTLGHVHEAEEMIKAAFEQLKKDNPDLNLKDGLMMQPEKVLQMIQAKKEFEDRIAKLNVA